MSTPDHLAARLAKLTPAQRARLEESLAGRPAARPWPDPGPTPPLSFAQERMWFEEQLLPGTPLYNRPLAMRIRGSLDTKALGQALAGIAARHQVLRGRICAATDPPTMALDAPQPLPLAVSSAADEAEMAALAAADAARPFDLAAGPLWRARLVELAPDDHALVLVFHHLIFDGWSAQVLKGELQAGYAAVMAGGPVKLPPLPVQYGAYAAWQRAQAASGAWDGQRSWWQAALAGAPLTLDLPVDHPYPAAYTAAGGQCRRLLPPALANRLAALARHGQATLFMALLAGWGLLLGRLAGQEEVVIGVPVAGRRHPDLEGLLGDFVNTLPVRLDLAGEPSVEELLGRVRAAALAAYDHQDLPFEQVVEAVQPPRSLARTPLYQAICQLRNLPPAADGPLPLEEMPLEPAVARTDLELVCAPHEHGLQCLLHYRTDLFEPATAAGLLEQLELLLTGMAGDRQAPVYGLPLLSPAARRRVVVEWNDTRRPYEPGLCVHHLFERQAARQPAAPAVRAEDGTLSYRELERWSAGLAAGLQARGVGPEHIVGLLAERSAAAVAGILAVLRAGAAWLPLDPEYPPDRLAYMLDEAQPTVVLAQDHLRDRLPACAAHVESLAGGRDGAAFTPPAVTPSTLAYVFYTSGSTGRPKGVMNEHGGIANFVQWLLETYPLGPGDRMLVRTPLSFDVSVMETLWPLAAGACLVVARPGGQREADYLADLIKAEGVTDACLVPSLLRALLELPDGRPCRGLRRLYSSGEALSFELQEACLGRLPAELHNLYGPTEAAVEVTAWHCERGREPVPIGRPIANTSIYILDKRRQVVPPGAPGELYIGGAQVARGYLRRPELTAERFIPDPFNPGGRLYRSGDLARRRGDGVIEYLGRLDQQVKVRGCRIELAEIEAVLGRHPGVAQAVVTVKGEGPSQQLVAYVVPAGEAPAAAELRSAAREQLPEYMVPTAFVTLPALPLTASGKIDRRALPEPGRPVADRPYLPPRTPLEELVVGVWQPLLGVPRLGMADDVFEMGAHSLLALQAAARLGAAAGVTVPVRLIFEAPTPGGLAERLFGLMAEAVGES